MAKKKAGGSMAGEIRSLLRKNRKLTGKQVVEALKEKFPGQTINEKSAGVAFSNARSQLGIRRSVVKKKPEKVTGKQGSGSVPKATMSGSTGAVTYESLQAAKVFLSKCNGDEVAATAALRQLSSLQVANS